jgi:hypothetical protein
MIIFGTKVLINCKLCSQWRIVRCGGCGAEAVHRKCAGLTLLHYRCDVCAPVLAGMSLAQILGRKLLNDNSHLQLL